MLLQGLFVPLTCPFYRDGVSYLRKLEHNVARYSLAPTAGLVALPPGGESAALTDAEAFAYLRSVGEMAAKEKVLVAGIEKASVAAALVLAEQAKECGFDAVLLAPPTDWARLVHGNDARELISYYEVVADHCALPIVLWSDSVPPSFAPPIDLIASLAQHPNVIGLADTGFTPGKVAELLQHTETVRREVQVTSIFAAVTRRMLTMATAPASTLPSGTGFVAAAALTNSSAASSSPTVLPEAVPVLKTRTRTVGLQLLSAGPANAILPLLQSGVGGMMPLFAACAPQACFEAYAAWKDGDTMLATERAERLRVAEQTLIELGAAATKAACDFNGYFGGVPRLPRLPLTAANRTAVEQALSAIRS